MLEASIHLQHACELNRLVSRRPKFNCSSQRSSESRQCLLSQLSFKNLAEADRENTQKEWHQNRELNQRRAEL
jgi:hypothetical protein